MTGQVRERGGQKNSCEKPLKNHPKGVLEEDLGKKNWRIKGLFI